MNIDYYKKIAWTELTETNFFHTLYYNVNGSLTNSGIDIIATILAEQNNQSFLGTNGIYYTPEGTRP